MTISIYRRAATHIFSSLINLYVIFLKHFKVAQKVQLLLSLMPQTSLQFAKKLVKPEFIKLAVIYDKESVKMIKIINSISSYGK